MQFLQTLLVGALALLPAVLGAPLARRSGDIIPGHYIVILKPQAAAAPAAAYAADLQASSRTVDSTAEGLTHTFDLPSLKGYAGSFDAGIIAKIAAQPDVAYVEPDRRVYASELVRRPPARPAHGAC